MTFKMNVMLAQAQECVLEKSIADARKSSIIAKVSAQCVEFYKLALTNLEKPNTSSLIGSRKVKVNIRFYCSSVNLLKINLIHYFRSLSNTFSSSAAITQR